MAYRVSITELGVLGDDTMIEGDTPGDVWRRVAKRLNEKHNIKLPDLEELGGEATLFPVVPRFDNAAVAGQQGPVIATATRRLDGVEDPGIRVIVTRLFEKLQAGQLAPNDGDIVPPGATDSSRPSGMS
jgi:hypothetical protein